jgi:hypothetical protein
MKLLCALLVVGLTGCTQTVVRSPQGVAVVQTSGNVRGMTYAGPDFAWRAEEIDHGTAALARGKAISERAAGIAGVVTALGASALLK